MTDAVWQDPEPWVTERGERQNTSVVPYRLGGKTYADWKPRTKEQYDEEMERDGRS